MLTVNVSSSSTNPTVSFVTGGTISGCGVDAAGCSTGFSAGAVGVTGFAGCFDSEVLVPGFGCSLEELGVVVGVVLDSVVLVDVESVVDSVVLVEVESVVDSVVLVDVESVVESVVSVPDVSVDSVVVDSLDSVELSVSVVDSSVASVVSLVAVISVASAVVASAVVSATELFSATKLLPSANAPTGIDEPKSNKVENRANCFFILILLFYFSPFIFMYQHNN